MDVAKICEEWVRDAYAYEHDLIFARATFQYIPIESHFQKKNNSFLFSKKRFLCLQDLSGASKLYHEVTSWPSTPQTPLLNFLKFLILTLQRDALPLFQMLKMKYKPSLERDSSFNEYLDAIGQVFYGLKPQGVSGFLGMIKSMFED